MTINGIDIAIYQAKQWNVQMAFSELSNESEWVDGTGNPELLNTSAGFKTIKVSVGIHGKTRQDIWKNAGNLVASLLKPCEVVLDGFDHKFFVYLKNAEQTERSLQRWHKATLQLVGYEYGAMVSTTTSAKELIITNEGNIVTPAVIELTPAIGLVSVTITGIARDAVTGEDKPVTISKLTKDKKVVINGETGLITEEGENKFPDTEIWDLPSLIPGENRITVDKDVTVTVSYKPRFI